MSPVVPKPTVPKAEVLDFPHGSAGFDAPRERVGGADEFIPPGAEKGKVAVVWAAAAAPGT